MSGIIQNPGSASGVVAHPGYTVTGQWHVPWPGATLANGAALAVNVARFIMFVPQQNVSIDRLGVRISTVGTTNIQLAVYNDQIDSDGHRPGTEIGHTSDIVNTSAASVNGAFSDASTKALTAGTPYWLGINNGDSACVCTSYATAGGNMGWLVGSQAQNEVIGSSLTAVNYVSTPLTFGTWGDLTAATFTTQTGAAFAAIQFRTA